MSQASAAAVAATFDRGDLGLGPGSVEGRILARGAGPRATRRRMRTSWASSGSSRRGSRSSGPTGGAEIPVVLIHGLWSNPWSWARMIEDLEADAALRDRYQFWTFGYSTGDPLPYSAALLRRDLDEVRRKFDPDRSDAAFDRMVLVGHSPARQSTPAAYSLKMYLRALRPPSVLRPEGHRAAIWRWTAPGRWRPVHDERGTPEEDREWNR